MFGRQQILPTDSVNCERGALAAGMERPLENVARTMPVFPTGQKYCVNGLV